MERGEEFAAIKNKEGNDSPATARELLSALHRYFNLFYFILFYFILFYFIFLMILLVAAVSIIIYYLFCSLIYSFSRSWIENNGGIVIGDDICEVKFYYLFVILFYFI